MASAYKPIAVFVLIIAVSCAALMWLSPRETKPRLKLGEKMIYGIYVGDEKVGSWGMEIENSMASWENVRCYKANYGMELGAVLQGGWLKFDENGWLRHARVWFIQNDQAKWATEIAYYPSLKVMQIVQENYEDNSYVENFMPMPRETTIAEHLWYLLRLERLKLGYTREFDLNAFPDATKLVSAKVEVDGGERIETLAGTFDCWRVRGQGPFDWMWVEKEGRLVTKLQERSGGQTRIFMLESYS